MQFAQGSTATLQAVYRDFQGNLTDPINPRVSLTNANGVIVVTNATPNPVSTGIYTFSYLLAENAPLGIWSIMWTGTLNGALSEDSEEFGVVYAAPGISATGGARLTEEIWVPRWAQERVGIVIYKQGAPFDPTDALVTATIVRITGGVIATRVASRETAGTYTLDLGSDDTGYPGVYQINWSYSVLGVSQSQVSFVEVGQASPNYAALDYNMQRVVDNVWLLFADGFDSPYGGPNLQVYFQSRSFGRNRLAQLLHTAMGRLNAAAQPHMTYTLGGAAEFPVNEWGPLLEKALHIEALKHLMRGYVEQPLMEGVGTARVDRRDYLQRWGEMLQIETEDYDGMIDVFKIAHMGLGRARALVSGGAYGNWGPNRLPLSAAARPRYWVSMIH